MAMGKWTKWGPSVDFFYIGRCTNVLPTIYGKSSNRVTTALPAQRAAEPMVDERLQWHRLQGVRVKKGQGLLNSDEKGDSLERLAVVPGRSKLMPGVIPP